MNIIYKVRNYHNEPEKPDIDDLIYGDDHYVSEK